MKRPLLPLPVALLSAALLAGCSVFSPMPAWELIKASGAAGSTALAYGSSSASNTIHHGDAPVPSLCIEYNRAAPAPELVPALQAELRQLRIVSRVYEADSAQPDCLVWLRYVAQIQYGRPPMGSGYQPYVNAISLSLQRADGRLMASSSYALDETWGVGRWASTRSKLAPVVKALITGFEN